MLSEKPWKLRAVLWLWIGMFIGMCTFAGMAEDQAKDSKLPENSLSSVVVNTLSLDGSILIAVIILLPLLKITWAEAFGFKTAGFKRVILLGVMTGLFFLLVQEVLGTLTDWILHWVHVKTPEQTAVTILKDARSGIVRAYLIFFSVAIAPAAEEILFRGALYPFVKQSGFPRVALWGTSIAFALIHFNLLAFPVLLVFALCQVWLYEKTDNLLACIIAHFLFNTTNVILLLHGNAF